MRNGLIVVALLGLLSILVVVGDFEAFGDTDRNANFVDAMPAGLREIYLENLLQTRDERCWICNVRLAGALQAIENDLLNRGNSYQLDYTKLIPFIPNDREFHEPIPELACNSILLSKSNRVYHKMIIAYRHDPDALVACVHFGLIRVRSVWPRFYDDIKQRISRALELDGAAGITDRWGNKVL